MIPSRAFGPIRAAERLAILRRAVLGQNHPDTLASADNLVADLRSLAEADDNT